MIITDLLILALNCLKVFSTKKNNQLKKAVNLSNVQKKIVLAVLSYYFGNLWCCFESAFGLFKSQY